MEQNINNIATIYTGFKEKFGIPRQSGLVSSAKARIVFEPEYRDPRALEGIEEYSHLWLIWGFTKVKQKGFNAMVTPPRLGGKIKKGVFATRSPFRPNRLGLSSVELVKVEYDKKDGPVLIVSGADLLDGTPIYDIKPYLAYTDAHPDALGSFGEAHKADKIRVELAKEYAELVGEEHYQTIRELLEQDPRAAYNKDPDYVYGMTYDVYDIRFTVSDNILTVCDIIVRDGNWKKVK